SGQLGDGSTDPSPLPVRADDSTMASARVLSTGATHTYAIGSSDDRAYCWGATELVGGMGVPGEDQLTPVVAFDISMGDVAALSAGRDHTCAADVDGDAWCWGSNDRGQLGNGGSGTESLTPEETDPISGDLDQVSSGLLHTCGVASGIVWCWGEPGSGRLGNGMSSDGTSPAAAVSGGVKVVGGGAHTCLLTDDGGVWCTGFNGSGQLGIGTHDNRSIFTAVRPG
ncbi:MAG: RCC1 domain-containing protein, partial [Actinomycetota bacterium]